MGHKSTNNLSCHLSFWYNKVEIFVLKLKVNVPIDGAESWTISRLTYHGAYKQAVSQLMVRRWLLSVTLRNSDILNCFLSLILGVTHAIILVPIISHEDPTLLLIKPTDLAHLKNFKNVSISCSYGIMFRSFSLLLQTYNPTHSGST